MEDVDISRINIEQFSQSLYAIHANNWQVTVKKLAQLFDAQQACIFVYDLISKQVLLTEFYNSVPQTQCFSTKLLPKSTFIKGSLDKNKFDTKPLSQSDLKSACSSHSMLAFTTPNGLYDSALAIANSPCHAPFGDQARHTFKALLPHLSLAIRHTQLDKKLHECEATCTAILNNSHKASAIINSELAISKSNRQFEDKLRKTKLIENCHGNIVIHDNFVSKQLVTALHQTIQAEHHAHEVILITDDNGTPMKISVKAFSLNSSITSIKDFNWLITIQTASDIQWHNVKGFFQLTIKEIELLQALYSYQDLKEIAQAKHVSINTLRTHLRSLFKKLSVNSQKELMLTLSLFS